MFLKSKGVVYIVSSIIGVISTTSSLLSDPTQVISNPLNTYRLMYALGAGNQDLYNLEDTKWEYENKLGMDTKVLSFYLDTRTNKKINENLFRALNSLSTLNISDLKEAKINEGILKNGRELTKHGFYLTKDGSYVPVNRFVREAARIENQMKCYFYFSMNGKEHRRIDSPDWNYDEAFILLNLFKRQKNIRCKGKGDVVYITQDKDRKGNWFINENSQN